MRADRQDDAQPQPGQLLRRDGAGRLPSRPRRPGHRLHQRSAAAGPALLLHRHPADPLGGPNFHEIPINRPVAPVHNNQRDGHMRQTINRGKTNYQPNSLGGGCPMQAGRGRAASSAIAEPIDGAEDARAQREVLRPLQPGDAVLEQPVRSGAASTSSQALRFELGKVDRAGNPRADGGHARPGRHGSGRPRRGRPRDARAGAGGRPAEPERARRWDPKEFQPRRFKQRIERSQALSMADTVKDTAKTRKVAILAADGVDAAAVAGMQRLLKAGGAVEGRRAQARPVTGARGAGDPVDYSLLTVGSVLFDAVYVPGGDKSAEALAAEASAVLFVREAFKHCKAIAASGAGVDLLSVVGICRKRRRGRQRGGGEGGRRSDRGRNRRGATAGGGAVRSGHCPASQLGSRGVGPARGHIRSGRRDRHGPSARSATASARTGACVERVSHRGQAGGHRDARSSRVKESQPGIEKGQEGQRHVQHPSSTPRLRGPRPREPRQAEIDEHEAREDGGVRERGRSRDRPGVRERPR